MKTIYRHHFCVRFILFALLLFLLPACGGENVQDDPDDPGFEEGIPTEVRITLSARSGNATRADDRDGKDKDPTSSIELIHDDWWIVFVDKNGKARIFEQKDVTDKVQYFPSAITDRKGGFEAETFKIIIPSGTYRIYAFANIDRDNISASYFEDNFLKHNKDGAYAGTHKTMDLSDLIGMHKFNVAPNIDMQWPDNVNIPMTGVKDKEIIRNTVEEAFNIEVVRAVAKVEFAFSNPSEDKITVTKLEFGPITTSEKISFVPNYGAIGKGPNDKLFKDVNGDKAEIIDTKQYGTMSFSGFSLTADPLNKCNMGVFGFYCKESMPAKDGGPFTIKLTITKNGVAQDPKELYTKDITYINRNDWIRIPIEFTDWKIYWKLRAYPPIGGYPPVFDQDEEGKTLSAKVTTGGEFELYPSKIMKGTQDFTSKVDWTKVTLTVLEGRDIFITEPHLVTDPNNANAKIIVGELDPKKTTGTAKVKINFYLDQSTQVTDVRTCIFTINRENPVPSSGTGDDSSDD